MQLGPFACERYFARHEFTARRMLSSSDCESMSLGELMALADAQSRALWDDLRLGYTEPSGHPLLRREIASIHPGLEAEHILEVVPEEGIFLGLQALHAHIGLAAGARAVVMVPAYQSLTEVVRALGCEVIPWWPREDEGWRFDLGDLRAALDDGARLVVVNLPHNPTGSTLAAAEWTELLEMARAAGAWLFSDEMYRFTERPGTEPLSPAATLYARAVTLGGMSKSFGLPGLRVGWLATQDRALLARAAGLKDYTTICGSAPSEILALIGLRARHVLLEQSRARLSSNQRAFAELVGEMPDRIAWHPPRAGTVALARLLGPESSPALSARLLADTGILTVPSTIFAYGDRHVRIGLGRADFVDGLRELAQWWRQAPAAG